MSTDEKMAAIGRLVTERTEAKQASALLARQIKDSGKVLYEAGRILSGEFRPEIEIGLLKLNPLIEAGGLEKLRQMILEQQALHCQIGELSKSLTDAGAE